ncbi:type I secretion system permease/ATPase [Massilia sp. PAMC28688]|uniref:type I secretion system permease/ATPase n=1 Tax=Massilia sp. PAMC28688 TaxID=2861283 RepID=UPI001C636AD1|nr:type I secretion system permease/ATPase [Massilia sp. PAMC28688]QYF93777.1 type I secretion system permease/ATPase [Massilia sp. PAMC28688]
MTTLKQPADSGTQPPIFPSTAEAGIREDLLHPDPLLDCLVELTRIHGRPSTRAALSAGLPLPKEGLTPSLFARAAAHAGFSSKIVRRSLRKIDNALLPVILLLNDNEACVLQGWSADGEAQVLLPDGAQGAVYLPRAELEARYTGIAIFSRPHFRFDERTPPLVAVPQRHWFWGTILEQRPIFKDILSAALLINLFGLAMPLFTMNVYDRVVPNFAVETLWVFAGGIVLVMIMDYIVRLLRGHFVDLASSRVDLQLSSLIMERVLGMRMAHRPSSVGAFAANLRSFETVRDFIASATVTTLIDLPFALLFLVVLAWISWPLLFIPLAGIIIVVIYSYLVQYKMRELSETTFRAAALRNATMVESLTALETIKAHGAESQMQARWEKTTAFLARVSAELKLLSSSSMNAAASLSQFVNVCVIVAGVYLIQEKMLTMGGLIAATMLSGRAMQPLGQMVGLLLQFEGAKNSLSALENIMATPTERSDESAFIHRPEIRGEIEFSNVHFSYPGRPEEALRGVSFRIQPGERVVIIGRIGSGKSTLQKLILGLYAPTKGAITLDGVDLRQLDPADLRRSLGYVEQDSMLFYGSLRDNIAIRAPYADDRAVVAAAELAGLTDFVNRHPEGFDMLIHERGESLSGGQRQGVAIARAVLLDPPVLLLDEPTSAMDYPSEHQFKERIRHYADHKTVIIVTHRSSLMDLADRIIVMDEGVVVADGPKDKVMKALQSGQVGRAK